MNYLLKILSLIFILQMSSTAMAAEEVPDNIVSIDEQSIVISEINNHIELSLGLIVKPDFFSYEEKFELDLGNFNAEIIGIDPIVTFFDKTFNKNKNGVRNKATVKAILSPKADSQINDLSQITINLKYQACTVEYCLFPTHTEIKYTLSDQQQTLIQKSKTPSWMKNGWFLGLFFVFFAGFLTSLTPCVYPMLPITLAVLGANKSTSRLDGFLKSATYVLGMALTYAVLGVFAATTGFMFGSLLSNSYFLVALSIVLFLGALSMFDIFEIKTPAFLQKRITTTSNKTSYVSLFITGAFSGLIAGPCVGPVLVGVLGYVSQTRNIALGFGFLFVFALGLGSLIMALGTFSNLIDKLPRSGKWMIIVKKLIGLSFIGLIVYFISPLLPIRNLTIVTALVVALLSLFLVLKNRKALHIGLVELSIYKSMLIITLLLVVFATTLNNERFERFFGYSSSTFVNTNWDLYSDEKLQNAANNNKYVVLDFYADWCAACRELKHETFSKQEIMNYSGDIKWLYFNSTKSSDELKRLKEKYNILGLPTILFFDQKGQLRKELTLTGFENAELFKKRLDQLFLKKGE